MNTGRATLYGTFLVFLVTLQAWPAYAQAAGELRDVDAPMNATMSIEPAQDPESPDPFKGVLSLHLQTKSQYPGSPTPIVAALALEKDTVVCTIEGVGESGPCEATDFATADLKLELPAPPARLVFKRHGSDKSDSFALQVDNCAVAVEKSAGNSIELTVTGWHRATWQNGRQIFLRHGQLIDDPAKGKGWSRVVPGVTELLCHGKAEELQQLLADIRSLRRNDVRDIASEVLRRHGLHQPTEIELTPGSGKKAVRVCVTLDFPVELFDAFGWTVKDASYVPSTFIPKALHLYPPSTPAPSLVSRIANHPLGQMRFGEGTNATYQVDTEVVSGAQPAQKSSGRVAATLQWDREVLKGAARTIFRLTPGVAKLPDWCGFSYPRWLGGLCFPNRLASFSPEQCALTGRLAGETVWEFPTGHDCGERSEDYLFAFAGSAVGPGVSWMPAHGGKADGTPEDSAGKARFSDEELQVVAELDAPVPRLFALKTLKFSRLERPLELPASLPAFSYNIAGNMSGCFEVRRVSLNEIVKVGENEIPCAVFEIAERFTSDGKTIYECTGRVWLNPGFPAWMVKASGEIKYNYLDWKPPFKHIDDAWREYCAKNGDALRGSVRFAIEAIDSSTKPR
ncbi:MAG: hypothetical protein RDV41_14650 [Planctomycetota bacterium]|nr:hypothetical protein [Planctomycetota bacterium]